MKTKYPGFEKCIIMMRSRDPQTQEDGFHWLVPHANENISELIKEFEVEEDRGLRCWLMELIAAAKSPKALSFFSTHLKSNNWRFRSWAIKGLKLLDTKEARTLLWQARSCELDTTEETERLRFQLENPNVWWLD